jgi:hypothetical protein
MPKSRDYQSTLSQHSGKAKIQTTVAYSSRMSQKSGQYCVLEWDSSNQIRLLIMDATPDLDTNVVFDVPLSHIERVGGAVTMLSFNIEGKKYRVDLAAYKPLTIGSLFSYYGLIKTSGIYRWVEAFKSSGVRVTYLTYGRLILIAAIFTPLLIIAIALPIFFLSRQ